MLHGSTEADAAASAMHFSVVTHIYNSPVGNVAAHNLLLLERKALTSMSRVCPFRKKKKIPSYMMNEEQEKNVKQDEESYRTNAF